MNGQIGVDMQRPTCGESRLCRIAGKLMEGSNQISGVRLVDGFGQNSGSTGEIADIWAQHPGIEAGRIPTYMRLSCQPGKGLLGQQQVKVGSRQSQSCLRRNAILRSAQDAVP